MEACESGVSMRKLGTEIRYAVAELGEGSDEARLNMRIQQVRARYKAAIEAVYRSTAPAHLAHTNKVIIMNRDGVKTLIVYVDDSLFAAELNAQRELIKLKLLELFGEDIVDFQISISKWKRDRDVHPYLSDLSQKADTKPTAIPLDDAEKSFVSDTASQISDTKVRESLKKAMTADMEWKKGKK